MSIDDEEKAIKIDIEKAYAALGATLAKAAGRVPLRYVWVALGCGALLGFVVGRA